MIIYGIPSIYYRSHPDKWRSRRRAKAEVYGYLRRLRDGHTDPLGLVLEITQRMKKFNLAPIEFGLKSKRDLGHLALRSLEACAEKKILEKKLDQKTANNEWCALYDALKKYDLLHFGGKMN
ncbi:MAG TPA: hypothetical protein VL335_00165 [Candidatus Paceibacterota bacterium]|nr:hypothetical protein [Candidatus Paceibacterota bacterium]